MFQLEIKKNITKYTEEEDKKTASWWSIIDLLKKRMYPQHVHC
jgi:hypothetical protein